MKLLRILPYARKLLSETIQPGEIVIDATTGNGNDTEFLAEQVGENGHVYAFDIQQAALDSTFTRLGELNKRVTLILDSHENVEKYVALEIGGAVFNLGYLPHSEDLSIVTRPDSTLKAIQSMIGLLKKGGLIAVSVYDGHEGGHEERDALLAYVKTLHQADVHVVRYELFNQRNNPPFLILLEKLKDFKIPGQIK
ncbi:tRNA (mnm(5)s(2)U34)-methyltransferase [Sporosarcina limicola]|uniref:SAM-dependent methyltransferase n=1 Tax=Sporosarcina limicola TaxID=34101 RepID=A0A927R5W3_9BACL|nr:class I SAM-dependent methyltransferase [Sporosarcina limicola]MBE1554339.1 SAM-dependent methyltransferase [Sporosarcina limicola]